MSEEQPPVFRGTPPRPSVGIGQTPRRGRLSVVNHVIHQRTGENPSDTISRYSRDLHTFDTGFMRETSIGPEWVEIDLAWLSKNTGHIVVQHIGPPRQQGVPTKEEIDRLNALVVEIGVEVDRQPVADKKRTMFDTKEYSPVITAFTLLLPRESQNWTPLPNTLYYLRTRKDESRVRITICPG